MPKTGTLRVTVSGTNVQVTPALREHAEGNADKLQRHFKNDDVRVEVVLSTKRNTHRTEVTVKVGSLFVRGEGRTEDMYVSIDNAFDRIERQVRKYKTRINRRLQAGPKIGQVLAEEAKAGAEDEEEPKIVRVKRFSFKPMTNEEAILQMELLGHNFFVFTNANTDEINVLYRRRDGNYGLIEPDF